LHIQAAFFPEDFVSIGHIALRLGSDDVLLFFVKIHPLLGEIFQSYEFIVADVALWVYGDLTIFVAKEGWDMPGLFDDVKHLPI
jgi:hypothetical protein